MSVEFIILLCASLVGFYMAANIGANDLANAMGTSVGSKAITIKQAVIISMVANALGAVLAGGHVTNTISKGIIDPQFFSSEPDRFIIGMFASLLAAGIWVNIATYFGLPVSTTHSIVGAVIGFGILSIGIANVSWGKVIPIVLSWIISPTAGAIIAGGIYYLIERKILLKRDAYNVSRSYAPLLIALVFFVIVLSLIFKGLKNLHLDLSLGKAIFFAVPIAAFSGVMGRYYIEWQVKKQASYNIERGYSPVESLFAQLQLLTACYVAFAHGANDVANAVGPWAAIFSAIKTKSVAMKVHVPFWMLFAGGVAVGGGLMAFGSNVIKTIGENITEINPVRGFCAEFGAATTILVCSRLGLPISTTHVLVGSVVGIGIARGAGTLDLRILKNICVSWLITLPFTLLLAMVLYEMLVYLIL
ncbi:MAG: phosphate permease [Deltaproteobacteria bacterium]|nr:MAG: phosphate permease [Deltaproteobacteria bacterium]